MMVCVKLRSRRDGTDIPQAWVSSTQLPPVAPMAEHVTEEYKRDVVVHVGAAPGADAEKFTAKGAYTTEAGVLWYEELEPLG